MDESVAYVCPVTSCPVRSLSLIQTSHLDLFTVPESKIITRVLPTEGKSKGPKYKTE